MKKYIYILSVAIIAIAGACNSDEPETDVAAVESKIMHIQPSVSMQPLSRVSSPSENTFVFDENDAIGISIANKEASITGTEANFNTKLIRKQGSWQQEAPTYWLNDAPGTQNDIIGYYPYTGNIHTPTALPLNLATKQDAISQMAKCDYLWGRNTVTKTNSNEPVSLQMSHVMTKLTFNVKLSGNYASYGGIENLQVYSRSNITLNLNSGKVSADGEFASVTPYKKGHTSAEYHQTYEAIIAPQKYVNDTFITFTLAGKNHTQPFSHTLLQGKHYTFLINANEDKAPTLLLISEVNINDWNTGESDDETITTSPQYKVGDLWPDEESPVAIVLSERIDNQHPGILMTLKKQRSRFLNYSFLHYKVLPGLFTSTSGKINTNKLKDYIKKNNCQNSEFPAFQLCAELGDEWFIPTYKELEEALMNFYYNVDQEYWFKYIGYSGEEVSILTSSYDESGTYYIIGYFMTGINMGFSYGETYQSIDSYAQMRAFRYY